MEFISNFTLHNYIPEILQSKGFGNEVGDQVLENKGKFDGIFNFLTKTDNQNLSGWDHRQLNRLVNANWGFQTASH